MKRLLPILFLMFCCASPKAQYVFQKNKLPDEVSILKYASLLRTGTKNLSISDIINDNGKLPFKKLSGDLGNLGFTSDNYWVKFQLKNTLDIPLTYYLLTGEPVTDNVNLYLKGEGQKIEVQRSGDNVNFSKRSIANRKTLFKIELSPGEAKSAFIELKNDGEKNTLPLVLLSQQRLLEKTYSDQMVMGFFYGILSFIAITYFFFFFALKELSFLYYSLYVVFVAFCQFALDGLYHQYIGTGTSWLSLHAVIVSAILSCFFFGKYSEIVLEIKIKNQRIQRFFTALYIMLGLVLAAIIVFPTALKYAYPIINVLTLFGLILIFASIAIIIHKKQSIDVFYTVGIGILAVTIILAILMNFGVFPPNFTVDNITKPGIGLEIMALSLSMANRIGILRNRKEELQAIALQKSEEMNDVKTYFLSNMSHELRTPLNAILGMTAIMIKESTDPNTISQCETIKLASHGLLSSVNDILDFSKLEKGELELERIDFCPADILNKVALIAEQQSNAKGITFEFATSLHKNMIVLGDPARLAQIIYNVLTNAIKFTARGGVVFEVQSQSIANILTLKIIIKDTGIGIPNQKLDTIFDLFSQTNSDNKRKHGGFGIGLSIVKVLTDLHDGEIKIESEVGVGTRFEITLPYSLQQTAAEELNVFPEDEYDLLGKHILLVEDNPMNQMIIQMLLEDWKNTKISIAEDGAVCLDMLSTDDTIDLIFMDLQMPVMDGYQAISAIRNNLTGIGRMDIPIIVITADTTKTTKERVFELGADDYMNKPVDEKEMYQKVTKILSSKPARRV
ncbi:response regulator [Agrobacterium tumefaciens]|nr:response regulator [Agrobacterium tumefaciens]NTE25034.1 response regulator [Agrobacterium tumefaciens]